MSIAKVAVNCACGLLMHVPHFNFRGELLKMVVQVLSVKTVDETFTKCRTTLEEIFRNDEEGRVSFDAVQMLTRMFKAKHYRVDESVINTFLCLRLLSELDVKASQETVENPRKRKKKDREFRTKKARKQEKENKEIEKELKEADATVSHEEREKLQGDTLRLVFVTYFKVLKERPPGLMAATLEGLAKYVGDITHFTNMY
jgi:nucleolar complex protein 3